MKILKVLSKNLSKNSLALFYSKLTSKEKLIRYAEFKGYVCKNCHKELRQKGSSRCYKCSRIINN